MSDQNGINGQNGQVESINTSQGADEIHPALSNPGNSQPELSKSSQITAEICTSNDQLHRHSPSSSSDEFLDSSSLIVEESANCSGLPDISIASLTPQVTPVVAEGSTCRNTEHDTVSIVNPTSVVIQPKGGIQPQVAIQPKAGPSSQHARCLPGTSDWESPGRDKKRTSERGTVIVQQTEPVLTVQFDNIPSISDSPLHTGKQKSGVPTLLPDGSSIRAEKSTKSKNTKK